jgi:hypothetical protein
VRLIIADTGPINYLVLIGHIDLLPTLFERVILPSAVQAELTDADAPPLVRSWIAILRPGSTYAKRQVVKPAMVPRKDSMRGRQQQSRWRSRSKLICFSWMTARAWLWLEAKDSA